MNTVNFVIVKKIYMVRLDVNLLEISWYTKSLKIKSNDM